MITILQRERHGYSEHRGRSPESIARRLYGRRASVRYSSDRNDLHRATVVVPTSAPGTMLVEATWFLDDAALAAASPLDTPEG